MTGHLLECAAYVTGGYYSGFKSLLPACENLGFPIGELAADGTCVITKEDNGTGGEVRKSQPRRNAHAPHDANTNICTRYLLEQYHHNFSTRSKDHCTMGLT